MRRGLMLLCIGTVGLTTGCGGGSPRAATTAPLPQAESGICQSDTVAGGPSVTSCHFVLGNGQQFDCNRQFTGQTPTERQLVRAGCRRLAPLKLSASERGVIARVDGARRCLTAHRVRVVGGTILPAPPAGSDEPDGEVVISSGRPTFIAFYRDAPRASRLEPGIKRQAVRTHVLVERHGAVTLIWSHSPSGADRALVRACAPR